MDAPWKKCVSAMIKVYKSDARNAMIFASPWPRAATSMATGWRIRLSQKPPRRAPPKPTPTWRSFAAKAAVNTKTMARRYEVGPWNRWAAARARTPLRYVKESDRTW